MTDSARSGAIFENSVTQTLHFHEFLKFWVMVKLSWHNNATNYRASDRKWWCRSA